VVAEVLLDLHEEIQQRQARVAVEALPRVRATPVHMRQLLRNLVSNALKFQRAEAPPEIKISGRSLSEGGWEISVQDNGIGFESSAHERIFHPFQRLHKAAYPGSGMGLAICRRIVNAHGGKILASSEPGCGSTFYFTVPAARVEEDRDDGSRI
jgi:signal transduction histidine kinase